MEYIVEVHNLVVKFGDFSAVKNVSFQVRQGEIFGFLGANGAGKTTTIRVLCGLHVPTSGRVIIDGDEVKAGSEQRIKAKVGYMSQRFTLYPDLTIEENLSFAASLRQLPRSVYLSRRGDLLDFIDFKQNLKQQVASLPGGVKQEIALVASIIHDPKLIFLDEPTAGVAPMARARFWELIRRLTDHGKTVFVTTHYMDEAENCGRIALMRSGELIALDSPSQLKKDTYQQNMYLVKITGADNIAKLLTFKPKLELLEPYGRHFHLVVAKEHAGEEAAMIKNLSEFCYVEQVAPSLEDVFVKLVER